MRQPNNRGQSDIRKKTKMHKIRTTEIQCKITQTIYFAVI